MLASTMSASSRTRSVMTTRTAAMVRGTRASPTPPCHCGPTVLRTMGSPGHGGRDPEDPMPLLLLSPSAGRPDAAAATLASFEATVRDARTQLLFVVGVDDPSAPAYPAGRTLVVPGDEAPPDLRWIPPAVLDGPWDGIGVVGDE